MRCEEYDRLTLPTHTVITTRCGELRVEGSLMHTEFTATSRDDVTCTRCLRAGRSIDAAIEEQLSPGLGIDG